MNIIITGASKGIGKAIAEIFAANGHNLFICARNAAELYKTVEELVARNPAASIKAKPFDLGKKEDILQFASWILQSGVPDILVNNAGSFLPGSVYNEEEGVLEKMIETNLYSAYHLTRALLPAMMAQRKGQIYNLCSIASLNAYDNGGAYSISKFALLGFTRNLRKEMMPFGIKVTAVLPGAVMTDSWQGFDNSTKRIMEAEDIAKTIYNVSQLSGQAVVEEIVLRPLLGDL